MAETDASTDWGCFRGMTRAKTCMLRFMLWAMDVFVSIFCPLYELVLFCSVRVKLCSGVYCVHTSLVAQVESNALNNVR